MKLKANAIVFDFDGVILESVGIKGDAFYELYAHAGPEIQKRAREYHIAHGGVSRFEKIRYYEKKFFGREVNETQVNEIADRFSNLVEGKVIACKWVNGAEKFLNENHKKLPLFVASATPTPELKRIIEIRNMNHYFKAVYGSPASKGENLKSILSQYKFAADRTVMIGDTVSDYKGAQEAGMHFIGRILPGEDNPFPASVPVMQDLSSLQNHLEIA